MASMVARWWLSVVRSHTLHCVWGDVLRDAVLLQDVANLCLSETNCVGPSNW